MRRTIALYTLVLVLCGANLVLVSHLTEGLHCVAGQALICAGTLWRWTRALIGKVSQHTRRSTERESYVNALHYLADRLERS
jgi:hypothetical protein